MQQAAIQVSFSFPAGGERDAEAVRGDLVANPAGRRPER
jgi:hypothetical protein